MNYYLETERLGFRRFNKSDAKILYENHNEPELKQWIPDESYGSLKETEGAIEFYGNCVDNNKLPFVLAIEVKDGNNLIGDTGINEVDGSNEEVEIGYSISSEHQRKGYATETVKAMTKFVVEHFQIKTLYGRVMKGNLASSKVMEKAGYVYIREEVGADDDPYGNGMMIYKYEHR